MDTNTPARTPLLLLLLMMMMMMLLLPGHREGDSDGARARSVWCSATTDAGMDRLDELDSVLRLWRLPHTHHWRRPQAQANEEADEDMVTAEYW